MPHNARHGSDDRERTITAPSFDPSEFDGDGDSDGGGDAGSDSAPDRRTPSQDSGPGATDTGPTGGGANQDTGSTSPSVGGDQDSGVQPGSPGTTPGGQGTETGEQMPGPGPTTPGGLADDPQTSGDVAEQVQSAEANEDLVETATTGGLLSERGESAGVLPDTIGDGGAAGIGDGRVDISETRARELAVGAQQFADEQIDVGATFSDPADPLGSGGDIAGEPGTSAAEDPQDNIVERPIEGAASTLAQTPTDAVLSTETATEIVQNTPEVLREFGPGETAETATAVGRDTTAQAARAAQENPARFAGGVAAGVALGAGGLSRAGTGTLSQALRAEIDPRVGPFGETLESRAVSAFRGTDRGQADLTGLRRPDGEQDTPRLSDDVTEALQNVEDRGPAQLSPETRNLDAAGRPFGEPQGFGRDVPRGTGAPSDRFDPGDDIGGGAAADLLERRRQAERPFDESDTDVLDGETVTGPRVDATATGGVLGGVLGAAQTPAVDTGLDPRSETDVVATPAQDTPARSGLFDPTDAGTDTPADTDLSDPTDTDLFDPTDIDQDTPTDTDRDPERDPERELDRLFRDPDSDIEAADDDRLTDVADAPGDPLAGVQDVEFVLEDPLGGDEL